MANRIFSVRLNLDDMCADLDALDTDKEMADWLRGFKAGSRGLTPRWKADTAGSKGYALGVECLEEAKRYQARQAEKGRLSASKRTHENSTTVEPRLNHGSTNPPTAAQPNQSTTIQDIQEGQNDERGEHDRYAPTPGLAPVDLEPEPPVHVPTEAFQRIRASRVTDVRQAVFSASLIALVAAMGARSDRGQEWDAACNGLSLVVVLAIFDWSMTRGQVLREPSQFLGAREDWESLSGPARSSIGHGAMESYGIPLKTKPKESA